MTATRMYADAWLAGDLAAIIDMYADDFVLHYFGESPLAGDHVGKDAALTALAAATARTNRRLLDIEDVLEGRVLSAIVAREEVGTDERKVVRRVLLYRTDGGKLTECWLYDEDQRAIDALWSA
jgi:uncharacterized protein